MKLKDKIIFITGASSGIGEACAVSAAKEGANLILTARRVARIEALAEKLEKEYNVKTLALALDVTDKEAVNALKLPAEWKNVDVLLNNAGLALTSDKVDEADLTNWDVMIDTNIKGLLYVTHQLLPDMLAQGQGHIVNIGSIAGHETYVGGNVYCATKHAVRAISKSLRLDLLGKNIRVSEIAPGAVETEFSEVRWNDKKRAKAFYQGFTPLTAVDIADTVLYAITRPAHMNVAEIVVTCTEQAGSQIHKQGADVKGMFD